MKTDYAYCDPKTLCIHRRACVRWIGNYTEKELEGWKATNRNEYVNHLDCIPNYSDINCTSNYGLLDRFRNSDGTKLKEKYEKRTSFRKIIKK